MRCKMSKFTFLEPAILAISQGALKTLEFTKHFRDEMAEKMHQLIRNMCVRLHDTFVLGDNSGEIKVMRLLLRASFRRHFFLDDGSTDSSQVVRF